MSLEFLGVGVAVGVRGGLGADDALSPVARSPMERLARGAGGRFETRGGESR